MSGSLSLFTFNGLWPAFRSSSEPETEQPDRGRRALLTTAAALSVALAAGMTARSVAPGLRLGPAPAEAASLADFAKAARNRGNAMFGTTEIASKSFRALPQWARVVREMKAERANFAACVKDGGRCRTASQKAWRKIIRQARGKSRAAQIKAVNVYFNRWPYKFDHEIYGKREHWAAPAEFLSRSGDCEDYSIAKYFALRELGFKSSELRVVIVMDRIRRIGHAVLAVYTDGDILVLDSLSDLIFSHAKYKHYIPQYSMNETTRWAHTKV